MAPRPNKTLNADDFNIIQSNANNLVNVYGEKGPFEGMQVDVLTFMTGMPRFVQPNSKNLTQEGFETFQTKAREYEKRIDDYVAQNPDRLADTPRTKAFEENLLELYKQDFQNIQKGISTVQEKELQSPGYFGNHGVLPNLNFDCFKPENAEKTEEALKQYPLDQFLKLGNELQKAHMDYEQNKDDLSPAENAKQWASIQEHRAQYLAAAKDLQEKSKNPTPETLRLFGAEAYLNGPEGFIGHRGLETAINRLEDELTKTATPAELQGLEDSLKKFNTARSIIFKKESDRHKDLREQTEIVQENMKKLNEGKLSPDERAKLKKETYDALKSMEEKVNDYIDHATEKGTKTPNTSSGKERLAGARDLQKFTETMKERFAQDPEVKAAIQREQETKYREACKADDAKFRESLSGGAQRFYDSKMKSFRQFDGMSHNMFQDASPHAQSLGVNNFELMAAEMIAMSAVKEGIKNGSIEADRIRIEHERAVKNIIRDENFGKWRESIDKGVDAQRRVGPMTMDELRQDFVKGMSKEMQVSAVKEQEKAKETEKAKEAENTKKAQKTTTKSKSNSVNKSNGKKEIKPVEKGGLKI